MKDFESKRKRSVSKTGPLSIHPKLNQRTYFIANQIRNQIHLNESKNSCDAKCHDTIG